VATQLKEVMTPEFKEYAKQVKANAQAIGKALTAKGYKMATGGTENHLILWDLRCVAKPPFSVWFSASLLGVRFLYLGGGVTGM
jgi:glycine/serine hydroxymethyltransferase